VFNIIPIPLLDGSLLFFATWEAVFRKPFPPKLHIPLLYAGLVLIAILFIAVSINDVWRVFG
jgi:regulator of sigma E protease